MRKIKFLITGADGLLGGALLQYAKHEKVGVVGFDRDKLDVADEDAVVRAIQRVAPTEILNCAVIGPKDCAHKSGEAQAVNVDGVKNLLTHKGDAKLVHFSSPAIFDGLSPLDITPPDTGPNAGYAETDNPKSHSVYGRTKWQSEQTLAGTNSIIIRTSWLYSEAQPFLLADVYAHNEWGRPTYCGNVWRAVNELIERDESGTFHVCGPEIMSRCEQARFYLGDGAKCGNLDTPDIRPLSIIATLARLKWSEDRLMTWSAWCKKYGQGPEAN